MEQIFYTRKKFGFGERKQDPPPGITLWKRKAETSGSCRTCSAFGEDGDALGCATAEGTGGAQAPQISNQIFQQKRSSKAKLGSHPPPGGAAVARAG